MNANYQYLSLAVKEKSRQRAGRRRRSDMSFGKREKCNGLKGKPLHAERCIKMMMTVRCVVFTHFLDTFHVMRYRNMR